MAEFDAEIIAAELWRAVEAQHRVSTMVLVDTLDEQALLERLLDTSKPAVSQAQAGLHWLLFTPFRYPPLPAGSRFRAPSDPGVFYGAELQRTACAELGYWRWRLLMDSPALESIGPIPQTLFQTPVRGRAIDLRRPPFSARHEDWADPDDYSHCQTLAREARTAGIQMIQYASVRDVAPAGCCAVLTHLAFTANAPIAHQNWMLAVSRQRVIWRLDSIFDEQSFEFDMHRWLEIRPRAAQPGA